MTTTFSLTLGASLFSCLLVGCATETPTTALVHNGYPANRDPSAARTVVQAFYATTLFEDVVSPGGDSEAQRVSPGEATAYALVAVGWDPSSSASPPPSSLRPMRSSRTLDVPRGGTLVVAVSSTDFDGDCGVGAPLSQADADIVTQRIFPGPFAGFTYDAASCVLTAASDAGAP